MVIVVPTDSAYVLERLGRYHHTLGPGLHFVVPLIDRVAFRFSLAPKDDELTDTCISRDNVVVTMASRVRWQIVAPERAAYASANVAEFVTTIVRTQQREWIAAHDAAYVRENERELEAAVLRAVTEPAAQAGAKITAVEIQRVAS